MATSASRGRRARLRLRTIARWLWYYESSPVYPDEMLLHSIPNNQQYFHEEMGEWALSPTAFKPHSKRDVDGMSFFREDFISARTMAKRNRHPHGVRVARVKVLLIKDMAMDVQPDPRPEQLPGHVVVPELRFVAHLTPAEKQNAKKIQLRLARHAMGNGLYTPRGMSAPIGQ